jgi:CHAT domain-containing protein
MRAPRSTLLVERFSIAYLPSAAMLSIDGKAAGPENLLAVAPAKSRLPYAIDEGRRVAEMYKPHSRTLLGKEATESRFKQEASRYSIVHVASHGKFDKANPLFSGIELEPDQASDGLLQVHEVLGLKMRASLVNLSACETARASGYFLDSPQSDDLIGLARAFLLAGSRAVLATLAPVEDRSSFRTMQLFYGQMRSRGNNAATALAAAQRLSRQNPSVAHPYYWAPYVVIGVL